MTETALRYSSDQKSIKNRKKTHKSTTDLQHQKFITDQKQNVKNLIPKKYSLNRKIHELKQLVDDNNKKSTFDLINKIASFQLDIDKLQKEISKIESNNTSFEYSVKNYDLLKEYYDRKKTGHTDDKKTTHVKLKKIIKSESSDSPNSKNKDHGIMNYFVVNDENVDEENIPTTDKKQSMNLNDFYEKFKSINDVEYHSKVKAYTYTCPIVECGKEMIISYRDGSYYCDCGYIETSLVSIEKINYKEPSQEKNTNNAYRRINHLTEIMSQIQANESTEIPHNIFVDIKKELKKRNLNKNRLDLFLLRRILKKLKYSRYYEHTPHILQIINGKVPPKFTKYYENKIKQMFRDIQKPFELYRPPARKNFLSYSFVLHKFCELLELDMYLDYFPLLKNINKLKQHDKIWKAICAHMKWKYYPSA